MSKREEDQNGWLEVKDNPVTKEGVFNYLGRDIGLDGEMADKIVRVYRPAEELEKALELFKNIPLIDDHELIGKEATPAEKKGVQGWVGEQVVFDSPYIKANLRIVSDSLISKIRNGKVDLSLGYKNDYEYVAGDFNGQRYDAIQRNIRPNHLALVDLGRTGKDVVVLDHYTIDSNNLGVSMALEEIKSYLEGLSEEGKNAILSLTESERKSLANISDDEFKSMLSTEDEAGEMTDEEKAAAEAAAVVAEEAATVATEAAELASEAAATGDPVVAVEAEAKLEEVVDKAEEAAEEVVTMDSMRKEVIKEINERNNFGRRAQKFLGTFDYTSFDSLQSLAEHVNNKLNIKRPKGSEIVAFNAWEQGRKVSTQVVTMDSATVSKSSIKSKWSK